MIKHYLLLLSGLLLAAVGFSQQKNEWQVRAAVEKLHTAMINADSAGLASMTSPLLAYVHSGGAVDDKTAFIQKIVSGKSDFVTITVTEQFVTVQKRTAVVRHVLDASTNDSGKPGTIHLRIMQVWHKQGRHWLLLARQAVKPS